MSFETPENMDKCCNTCRWNEPFNGVCYNALIFVAAPGAMLIGALLIYLFALCCKQISGLWREQK